VSRAIADELPVPCHILPNPLDRNEFPLLPDQQKDKDLLFVGRLVSDKGCSIFIRALSELKSEGLEFGATIMGDGSEVGSLKNLAKDLEVDSQIDFAGLVTHDRAQAMRRHKVLIVPSLWKEPFGLVAIEGIACGCAVIASDIGGLPEAVGPCGVLFEPGDVKSLASHIRELMQAAPAREAFVAAGAEHLKQFDAKDVAARYLSLFASLRE
jgi:glycosyltransferase involved in cell wall biosynthesis